MSWVDKIQSDMIIQTGDGKEYRPNWMNAQKNREYNTTEFDFPEVSGTLVKRTRPRGMKYSIQLFFQGKDHLDTTDAFMTSADDPRPWTITHPFYGRILVQPTGLSVDNSQLNVSSITGTIIETLNEDYPKSSVVAREKIQLDALTANTAFADMAAAEINTKGIIPQSIVKQQAVIGGINAQISPNLSMSQDVQGYFNSLALAQSFVDDFGSEPLQAITQQQNMILAAATLGMSVTDRLQILTAMYTNTATYTLNLPVVLMDKVLFQTIGASCLTSMCYAAANPQPGNYRNRDSVLEVVEQILDTYDDYLTNLDAQQSSTGGSPDSFVPDFTTQNQLSALINFTVTNLFDIALNARQERTIVLEYDSNWVVLAHRFYGLKSDDSTIVELMENNNAGLNEILLVRKNRKVRYYV